MRRFRALANFDVFDSIPAPAASVHLSVPYLRRSHAWAPAAR